MPIELIDTDLCTGCGNCVNACMVDVIRVDQEAMKALKKDSAEMLAAQQEVTNLTNKLGHLDRMINAAEARIAED